MGVYDDAARFAAEADAIGFVARLLAFTSRRDLLFRGWLNPRTAPLPGGPERTADLLAILDDPLVPASPWLLGVELQSRADETKLAVTLETTGIFTARAHPSQENAEHYRVTSAIVHLTTLPSRHAIDARLGRFGTYHRPISWAIAHTSAKSTLDQVANDSLSWGQLFWVSLMRGADQERLARRWKDLVLEKVTDRTSRSDLVGIALVFAELAGRFLLWQRVLGGWEMTESAVVNSWIRQGEVRGELVTKRADLLELLEIKFPGEATPDVIQLIEHQESMDVLRDWFRAGLRVETYADFLAVLRE